MVTLRDQWWIVALRGLLAVGLGVLVLLWSEDVVRVLGLVLGAYVFLDGALSLWAGLAARVVEERSKPLLLRGVVGLAAGAIILAWRGISVVWILSVVAAWLVVTALAQMAGALRTGGGGPTRVGALVGGGIAVGAAILLALHPEAGPVVLWVLGAYGVAYGLVTIGMALGSRRRPA